ncbi:MAG: DUF739 family protein [Lachnospiraceae bacterium]|nr:DUF739 family protein [Lachnospiraceae bacterium]
MNTVKEYDYRKLRGRIKEKLGTERKFADKIGRTQNYISKVFKNGTYFTQKDISIGAEVLDISVDKIGLYFFTKKVHKNETTKLKEERTGDRNEN